MPYNVIVVRKIKLALLRENSRNQNILNLEIVEPVESTIRTKHQTGVAELTYDELNSGTNFPL